MSTYKYAIPFFKMIFKYKKQHFIAAFFMLCSAASMIILPLLTMRLIDEAIRGGDTGLLFRYIIIYLMLIILQAGCKVVSDYMYSFIGKRFVFDMRYKIIRHLQKLSGRYYSHAKPGELLAVVNDDVATVEDLSTSIVFQTISDILMSLGMLIFLFYLQPDLLVLSLALQPLLFLIQSRFNKIISKTSVELRNQFGAYMSVVQEFLASVMHYSILNANKHFFRRYIPISKSFMRSGIKFDTIFSLNMNGSNLFSGLTTLLIFGYGGYHVIYGTLTLGGLIAFNQYSQRLLSPIIRIVQLNVKLKQSMVSVERIFRLLDTPVEISQNNKAYKPEKIQGLIEFKHTQFSYDENKAFIDDINLVFEEGKVTAIVGESGAGKSTLVHLLLRLWDIHGGEIKLDGRKIQEYNLKYMRKNINVVSQDIFLFHDTIRNNLLLSNDSLSVEKMREAAKKAGIDDFIMALPDQYDTVVGERGIMLSGGQKQRIAIARALLKDAPIIVFDEATSSLDATTEHYVSEQLQTCFMHKTVVVIAHRLSTVERADKVYVMKEGRVVEAGTHHELLANRAYYYRLYAHHAVTH
ncbi:ABC transporter ATP-binding protein [Paenibacillus oleatilyticus]|uniref:ABC transporter ATP-binding protein n=1 Tax=Paenibacillus oleatilyticus TaxID=2594886 RepID=UPI001C200D81|nr:ABC transporter ATP-binding protein [Paenibacillus oleatilyticus]MBU7318324.1 ABC transporter ATP-binding protein/permease [Paenibacillus oleatilyticus]